MLQGGGTGQGGQLSAQSTENGGMKYLNAAVQFKLKNYANICTTAAANKKLTRQKTVARKKAGSR